MRHEYDFTRAVADFRLVLLPAASGVMEKKETGERRRRDVDLGLAEGAMPQVEESKDLEITLPSTSSSSTGTATRIQGKARSLSILPDIVVRETSSVIEEVLEDFAAAVAEHEQQGLGE